ncbi:ATP-binding protein [Elioraea sp. Yellowstone]|jgi:predicted HTH transcriptional regulator|uniref:AlbA family DNA-binding domain-containing protein n=1 Tax=Elioraea sp. Yellowstone TaxID=2592070 RepID=UPI0011507F90|nr:ATP-binding protein [Elioraea sp. Yellowstone]TQF77374.1 ATP-binding protein [Elioraea sp. Yellowstone]
MLDDIDWDDISIETLRSLVESKVPESERLDYKRQVYGSKDNLEIAKDVSALANTQGGHVVLGISETEGEPSEIVGLGRHRS